MKTTTPDIVSRKNEWLLEQVNVQYPTPESLIGRDLYVKSLLERNYEQIEVQSVPAVTDELYRVDFHRLTVMFALIQAKRWVSDADQNNMVEFLTQIILLDEYQLYVGFNNGEPSAAALLSYNDDQVLVSDVFMLLSCDADLRFLFAQQVLSQPENLSFHTNSIWLETE